MGTVVFCQGKALMEKFNFKLLNTDNNARAGLIQTAHGEIETPIFMPVGTSGSVKAMHLKDVKTLGAQIILGNTYHLMLRPGEKIMKKFPALRKVSFDGKLSKIKKVNKNNKEIIILVVVFENINIQNNNEK